MRQAVWLSVLAIGVAAALGLGAHSIDRACRGRSSRGPEAAVRRYLACYHPGEAAGRIDCAGSGEALTCLTQHRVARFCSLRADAGTGWRVLGCGTGP
ncbi:MAG: hypothetical protein H6648_07365 [Caldilineae bacterium]|nr:hypothetical protein [Chloroflexota bacterium]MCB9176962.1 hypothetical protein [Caldilineae bacterium]